MHPFSTTTLRDRIECSTLPSILQPFEMMQSLVFAFLPYFAELNNKCMEAKSEDEMYMKVNAISYEVRYHQNTLKVAEKIDQKNDCGGNSNGHFCLLRVKIL